MVSAPPEHALSLPPTAAILRSTGSFLEQMRTRMVVNDFLFYIVICKTFFPFLQ